MYFRIVGAQPLFGRVLKPEDCDPAAPPVAVASERLWRSLRSSGFDLLTDPVLVAGRAVTVVGIVETPFEGVAVRGVATDLWVPTQDESVWHIFGRLRNAASAVQADAEAKSRVVLFGRYEKFTVGVREGLLPPFPGAAYLAGIAVLILCASVVVVAAASVTNLFLARTSARRAEIAVRLMLGAPAEAIRRLVSLEVVIIVVAAGLLSVGSAMFTVRLVVDILGRSDRMILNLQPDWRIFGYASLATLATVVGISRIISAHVAQSDGLAALSAIGGSGGNTAVADLTRRRLLSLQVAGATMILILAALLVRSASSGLTYSTGFRPTGAAVGWIDHQSHGHRPELARAVERQVLETARASPEVDSAAIATALPIDGRGLSVRAVGDGGRSPVSARAAGVSSEFFSAFGLELRRGRDFLDTEVSEKLPVAALTEAMAETLWPSGDPIGRTIHLTDLTQADPRSVSYTVIGIVANPAARFAQKPSSRFVFVPISWHSPSKVAILSRGRVASKDSTQLLRTAVAASGRNLALQETSSLEDAIAYSRGGRRSSGLLLIAVGLLAASIALVGIYGLTAQSMNQRHREFGILIALGARNSSLVVRVLTETGGTLAKGAAYGVIASIPGVLILRRYVWDLQPLDWIVVIAVPVILGGPGILTATLPLTRVIRRPVSALLRAI